MYILYDNVEICNVVRVAHHWFSRARTTFEFQVVLVPHRHAFANNTPLQPPSQPSVISSSSLPYPKLLYNIASVLLLRTTSSRTCSSPIKGASHNTTTSPTTLKHTFQHEEHWYNQPATASITRQPDHWFLHFDRDITDHNSSSHRHLSILVPELKDLDDSRSHSTVSKPRNAKP
jgi:hypothetical protein